MPQVNLTEVLIEMQSADPDTEGLSLLRGYGLEFVAPDERQAEIAATARRRCPLNLGDCFAYALAVELGLPILTLERGFERLDAEVILPATALVV